MKKNSLTLTLALLTATLLPAIAHASTLTLTLSNPSQNGAPGSTLSFFGTLFDPPSKDGTTFLNGDSLNFSGPGTTSDDGFFLGFPTSLDPGDSFTGLLFTITLPTTAPVNVAYLGSFTILGGTDGSSQDVLNLSPSGTFQVNTVPEPTSIALLMTGLSGLAVTIRRKRIASA